jgi:hypothetical protein
MNGRIFRPASDVSTSESNGSINQVQDGTHDHVGIFINTGQFLAHRLDIALLANFQKTGPAPPQSEREVR